MSMKVSKFILVLLLAGAVFAGRQVRTIDQLQDEIGKTSDYGQIKVDQLIIETDGNDIILKWNNSRQSHPQTGSSLSGYRIECGNNLISMRQLTSTRNSTFRHSGFADHKGLYYTVIPVYEGEEPLKFPGRIRRDGSILLDFEDGELNLLSFGDQEDVDPDAWEVSDEERLPESEHSLKLFGNTWKKLPFQRAVLTDTTVWTIGVFSDDPRNSYAQMQAFGIGDGENEVYYVFRGIRSIWEHEWVVATQDVYPRGQWHEFRLAVGYDFKIRHGYLPSIDEIYFINDNDEINNPVTVYFDDIKDITESMLPEPKPKIRWRFRDDIEAVGYPVAFTSTVDNRDEEDEMSYEWDFGDGLSSELPNPVHVYKSDGIYTASLIVEDQVGRAGYAKTVIETGNVRTPNRISAIFTGDIMIGRRYIRNGGYIQQNGPEAVFERIVDRFSQADIRVTNLEILLTDAQTEHPTKGIAFSTWPANVTGLTYAGIDIAMLANNHMSDFLHRGLEQTIEVLDAAGIGHNGAGMTEYEALKPVFRTINGIRVGFLSFCNRTGRDYNSRPFLDATFDTFGYAYFSADNIIRSVPEAAAQCDLLVMYTHGGWEYETAPTMHDPDGNPIEPFNPARDEEPPRHIAKRDSAMRELEQLAIDLGVGLVIGGHPHVLQGLEVYNNVVIAHSMGNFVFDQNFFETWPSMIVDAKIGRDGVEEVFVEPFFVDRYLPTQAVGGLGRKIIDRLAGYSYDLNAQLVPEYNRMRAKIALHGDDVRTNTNEHAVSAPMRFDEDRGVYRSGPIKLSDAGFISRIVSITPDAQDPEWRVSLGRDALLVGNMELEGADIWNYNSGSEGRTDAIARTGRYSSYLIRQEGWQDGVTDLIQRIPVNAEIDRLTLSGWLRTTNARDARLSSRFYSDRYQDRRVGQDQPVDENLQGDNDWTFRWGELEVPDGALFLNIRWQMWGAEEEPNQVWADDVEVVKWEPFIPFEGHLGIDFPNDLYYLQVETRRPMEEIEVIYRTSRLEIQ